MLTSTQALCEFLANVTYEQLPAEVIQHAKLSILNALGCGINSASASPSLKARKATLSLGGSERTCTVLARPERTDLQTAALLNGIAITTADYDDTHLQTVIHPSGTVLAAILAWGEVNHMSGKEVVLAFAVGIEALLRIGIAISPGHYTIGWHVTGTTGSYGAAAGVAKLLNLSAKQFEYALGHITSITGGTRGAFGTDTKTLHMGRGAQNGILAAVLAREDFDTGNDIISYWAKLVSPSVNTDALNDRLGQKWDLLDNTFKPYPCGIVIHPLIDGGLELQKRGISPRDVQRIHVKVNPQCVRLCNIRHPKTALEAIFSLYHGCAVALLYGAARKSEYTDEICTEKQVAEVREKIEVVTDAALRDDEAHLIAVLEDRKEVVHIKHAKGSLANPLTQRDVEAKFIEQSKAVLGLETCKRIVEICGHLESLDNIGELLELCQT